MFVPAQNAARGGFGGGGNPGPEGPSCSDQIKECWSNVPVFTR